MNLQSLRQTPLGLFVQGMLAAQSAFTNTLLFGKEPNPAPVKIETPWEPTLEEIANAAEGVLRTAGAPMALLPISNRLGLRPLVVFDAIEALIKAGRVEPVFLPASEIQYTIAEKKEPKPAPPSVEETKTKTARVLETLANASRPMLLNEIAESIGEPLESVRSVVYHGIKSRRISRAGDGYYSLGRTWSSKTMAHGVQKIAQINHNIVTPKLLSRYTNICPQYTGIYLCQQCAEGKLVRIKAGVYRLAEKQA